MRRNRYAVTADGRRFLILTAAANQPSTLNVVFDWTAALKR
jgi:hypothetical protein